MKLIFLFFLATLPFQLCQEIPSREISKYSYDNIYPSNLYETFYVQTSNYPKEEYIYFKMTVHSGYFKVGEMRYKAFSAIQSGKMTLDKTLDNYGYTSGTYYSNSWYDYYYYYFRLPKPSENYLYIAPPYFFIYTDTKFSAYVTVENFDKDGYGKISIFVWIGIALFVVVAAAVSIIIYICKRKRGKSMIIAANAELISNSNSKGSKAAYY